MLLEKLFASKNIGIQVIEDLYEDEINIAQGIGINEEKQGKHQLKLPLTKKIMTIW